MVFVVIGQLRRKAKFFIPVALFRPAVLLYEFLVQHLFLVTPRPREYAKIALAEFLFFQSL